MMSPIPRENYEGLPPPNPLADLTVTEQKAVRRLLAALRGIPRSLAITVDDGTLVVKKQDAIKTFNTRGNQ